MAFLSDKDCENVEGMSFDAMPAGTYIACISDSEMKSTKAGDGEYLKLKLTIIDGEFKNRVVFDNLNLRNKSEQAVKIAKATLTAIRHATGVMQPRDSAELHNIPMAITLGIREYNGEKQNFVKKYDAVNKAVVESSDIPF